MRSTMGWDQISLERKRELIAAVAGGRATRGPVHVDLDLTDRCNVACYFCNQQDTRTKEQIPLQRAVDLIDELVETGLRSVRLAGGGDPLFHREAVDVIDHLERKGVVIDNITTNGIGLDARIAERLVRGKAREVIISLNAVDPTDYQRMMQVKPALFETVLTNVRRLIALRGESLHPVVVVQFLLDQGNWARLVEMYELGRALGCDRIAVAPVLEIPLDRIAPARLLTAADCDRLRPLVAEIHRRDRDARLLQIDSSLDGWSAMLAEIRAETGYQPVELFPTAPAFLDQNGGCFFTWYSATIVGNGDIYPCCLLVRPDYRPLGNTREGKFADQWNGPGFETMRREMREVLLHGSEMLYRPGRFERLHKSCVGAHSCWMKNIFFRGDEDFYREFATALTGARKGEIKWLGRPSQMVRRLETLALSSPRFRRVYETLRRATLPLRTWTKRRFGWNVSGVAVPRAKS